MRGKAVGENIREMHREKMRSALEEKRKISRHIRRVTKKGLASGLSCGEKVLNGLRNLSKKWFTHVFLLTILFGYAALGAVVFSILEGSAENVDSNPSDQVNHTELRADLIQGMWSASKSANWESLALEKVENFETEFRKVVEQEKYVPAEKKWGFWSSMFYCGTVFTTIGYGHISPVTAAGRIATIIYAAIGIPLTLMVLVDIGKLFTKAIKFLFKFIRRFYYTGSCRRVRSAMPVGAVTKALHTATEKALSQIKDRSPSTDKLSSMEEGAKRKQRMNEKIGHEDRLSPTLTEDYTPAPSPSVPPRSRKNAVVAKDSNKSNESGDENWFGTSSTATSIPSSVPMAVSDSVTSISGAMDEPPKDNPEDEEQPDAFVVDDEFNLPVSIALLLLVGYISLGAFLFTLWENWNLFEAFYFIFISISTIGFGDYLPTHPMFMMASFLYLLFGLALTSMCINVTQEALAATLNDAKLKLSARMGLEINDAEDVDESDLNKPKVEVAPVHNLQVMPTPPPRLKRKRSAVPDDEYGTEV